MKQEFNYNNRCKPELAN